MAVKGPITIEIQMVEITPKGSVVYFDTNPNKAWSLLIGAETTGIASKLFFPNKYRLADIVEQIEKWPYIQKPFFLYDDVYPSIPASMKYNMNTYPHNWRALSGVKKIPGNGIMFTKTLDLRGRRNQNNVRKITRRTLRALERPPVYVIE